MNQMFKSHNVETKLFDLCLWQCNDTVVKRDNYNRMLTTHVPRYHPPVCSSSRSTECQLHYTCISW